MYSRDPRFGVAELRREHDPVAPALEHLPEQRLAAAAVAVDVGGVEQGHADVERGVDDGARAFFVHARAEVVAAESDDRDLRTRAAERAVPHPPAG